ncbi:MAG: polysaccharide deacetylase family protein [Brevundimonas sp.]
MRLALIAPFIALAAALCLPAAVEAQQIAITIDDAPVHGPVPEGETHVGVAARMIAALSEAGGAPATIFINGGSIEQNPDAAAALDLWRAAGHALGNHTWTHENPNAIGAEAYEAGILHNEPLLAALMGERDWRWFRYPFLAEGDDPVLRDRIRAFLDHRGYRVASVTMSFDDWAWTEPYVRCRAQGDDDPIARMERAYMDAAEAAFDHSRAMAQRLYGEDIPYVLLLHTGAFHARMLPQLLALYRDKGATFVSLEEAQSHPFYEADMRVTPSAGPLYLETALTAQGQTAPPKPWDISWLEEVCR